jgi:hypothetical protein
MSDRPRNPTIDARPTVRLDMHDLKPTWPIVIASLEQLAEWSILALRLNRNRRRKNALRLVRHLRESVHESTQALYDVLVSIALCQFANALLNERERS